MWHWHWRVYNCVACVLLSGEGLQKYFKKCEEKLGFVPNVLRAYSHNETRLSNFVNMYNELMLSDQSKLSKV